MPFSDDIRLGIVQSADALGIDPLDLATVISYETGGTFDPTKKGPTTKWGTHRGFLQFGEPQAAQHGVDWSNPVASQLGPSGAVVSYLKSSGVKPGMGLLDVYSAVNAGAPGLYNRSDAAAGGAPGTVYDKVTEQMSGHRAKATSFLGGEYEVRQSKAPTPSAPAMSMAPSPDGMTQMSTMPTQPEQPQPFGIPQSGYSKILDAYRQQLAANTPGQKRERNEDKRSLAFNDPGIIRY